MDVRCSAHLSQMKKNAAPFPTRRSKYSGQSVRAIPIHILTVGKRRSQGIQLVVQEYNEKLKFYGSIEDIQIKSNPKNSGNMKVQIEAEDRLTMQQISPEDWVVVLDEHGADIGSEEMADLVGDAGRTNHTQEKIQRNAAPCIVWMDRGTQFRFLCKDNRGFSSMVTIQALCTDIIVNYRSNSWHVETFMGIYSIHCLLIIYEGSSTLVFCIGGPYGHGPLVRERADVTIRLSSMVLNHQIALIVLMEQLYRAWTIIKGQKYHH